jgi:hypothetical protein
VNRIPSIARPLSKLLNPDFPTEHLIRNNRSNFVDYPEVRIGGDG